MWLPFLVLVFYRIVVHNVDNGDNWRDQLRRIRYEECERRVTAANIDLVE
jgi:hypothetical protein